MIQHVQIRPRGRTFQMVTISGLEQDVETFMVIIERWCRTFATDLEWVNETTSKRSPKITPNSPLAYWLCDIVRQRQKENVPG